MSQRYEYSLGLRVHHPSIDPRAISRGLGMRHRIAWKVGEQRASPAGTPLPGTRRDTYWSKTITPHGIKVPAGNEAEKELHKLIKRLRQHKRFLRELRRTGGSVEIWLSSHSSKNYSFTFVPELIRSIHELGCQIIVDVFPYRQNWGA